MRLETTALSIVELKDYKSKHKRGDFERNFERDLCCLYCISTNLHNPGPELDNLQITNLPYHNKHEVPFATLHQNCFGPVPGPGQSPSGVGAQSATCTWLTSE